ncbi:MAG: hypothetical protein M1829_002701 [Trizodia sp. TS-e1964]|nr:MAG: hypothetical protein M1829_002701 [Trizodia sp. TS-e1964]
MGQYLSAHQSFRDFAAVGIRDWSLQHAFFADMGGFILQTSDWRCYVSISRAVLGRIKDKNKVDDLMRFIMVMQTIWFLANFFARLAQGLAITAIEMTTVAFIYSSLPIVFLWRHKPADVGMAEVLVTDSIIAEILLAGGDAAREPYVDTPLDFIGRKGWAWIVYWSHFRHVLNRMHISAESRVRPLDRFSNFNTPEIPKWIFCGGALYYFGFAAIFVAGWNMSLPTYTEGLLRRVASLLCLFTLLSGEIDTEVAFRIWPNIRARRVERRKKGQVNPSNGHKGHILQAEGGSGALSSAKSSRPNHAQYGIC